MKKKNYIKKKFILTNIYMLPLKMCSKHLIPGRFKHHNQNDFMVF